MPDEKQPLSRRSLLAAVPAVAAAAAQGTPAAAQQPKRKDPLAPELVKEFVLAAHRDLDQVKELYAKEPALLNATWDWGGGDFETALGGAGHTGQKGIARFLLEKGARLDLFVAAMLGELEVVKAALTAYPNLIDAKGPHGIPLLVHAKMGGTEAKAVLEYLEGVEKRQDKMLSLAARYREPGKEGDVSRDRTLTWDPAATALIVCDVWDTHWCQGAAKRVEEIAPRMDWFVRAARERGMLIVHAPSGCMEFYKQHPARRRAQLAPAAPEPPAEIGKWCYWISDEEKAHYPIDQSDGGCDCTPVCATSNPWKRQIASIEIRDEDAISDSGTEIWNLFTERGIRNVMVLGVHTNMCVLGRPFGLRNLARYGKQPVLVRDLTDTMYNHRAAPFVNHFRGTDLTIHHVERWVCPTITSDQLLGGAPFRFGADTA